MEGTNSFYRWRCWICGILLTYTKPSSYASEIRQALVGNGIWAAANAPSRSTISDILRKDQNFTSKILSVCLEELLSGSSTKKLANLSSKYWSNTWKISDDLMEFLPRATKWTEQLARGSSNLLDSNCRSNYQCSGGSLQNSRQKNFRFDWKFSKIVFALWNFVRSLKFYYKNNFCPSLHAFKINWIGLFYSKLNSRKWENSFCVLQGNSPKYSNDQRGKLDWNWLKFYGERNSGLHAITAPSYKQPNKLSQLQNTQLNLLTVTFLAFSKWTEINLSWLVVDGCVKEGKRLTITVTFRSEI